MRTIGVCTGGGDCPGLNAVIRGVVKAALLDHGWRVIGIEDGFDGLIWPEKTRQLDHGSVRGILGRGGTILGTTNRGNPFGYQLTENGKQVTKDFSGRCVDNMKKLGIDALVVIGGDGTLKIANDFYKLGVPVVGVPKTIDNDLSVTEVTFGFETAVQTATEAIDRIQTTAESHHRVMIVELMGRDAGWITLWAGLAGDVDVVLIPEIPFTLQNVCDKIEERERIGQKFTVIVIAEGAKFPPSDADGKAIPATQPGNVGNTLGYSIRRHTGKDVRVTVLGHIQRGGTPTAFDRLLGLRFGVAATDLIAEGRFGHMVSLRCGRIQLCTLEEAIGVYKIVNPADDIVRTARAVGVSFGD
ncbi:MAG TPA: ATP-dependent 6-phosphofructokinase [Verrucomicrobiae bacterium]|nr:ATP-dependent 6-phosphofructokinase [Verrucomicrobiae bacterium]